MMAMGLAIIDDYATLCATKPRTRALLYARIQCILDGLDMHDYPGMLAP